MTREDRRYVCPASGHDLDNVDDLVSVGTFCQISGGTSTDGLNDLYGVLGC
jgi:hypothetical protein